MMEILSNVKKLLIDVMLEKSLPDASRIKLKDCISMMETFSNFLNNKAKEQEEKSTNFLSPLHSGLSKSSDRLNVKSGHMTKSRSTSDLANFDVVSQSYLHEANAFTLHFYAFIVKKITGLPL